MIEEPGCIDAILHPLLKTLEVTQNNISLVLENYHNVPNITYLTLCFDLRKQGSIEPQLLAFVGSLQQLTALKLSNCCSDQLMSVLGLYCPQLKIFDAEADNEMVFTDRGLSYLSNCQLLQSVLFNDEGTEYDADERYQGITGQGLAHLIVSLKHLNLLLIDPHLIREAIRYLKTINVHSKTFHLKYLHLRYASKDFMTTVVDTFPHLSQVRLEDPNKEVLQPLSEMSSLEDLTLSCYAWVSFNELQLKSTVENLRVLTLRNPKILGIDINLLKNMGKWCLSLESLTIAVYNEGFVTTSHHIPDKETFFPKLKILMFEGDVSIHIIETFLLSVKGMEQLSIYVHGFNFAAGVMDQLMLHLVKIGNFSMLKFLQFYHWEVSLDTLLYLIDQCPCLKTLWGLNLLNLSNTSKDTVRNHIKKNNLNIELFEGLYPEPVFGLQFLDKKFRRQSDRLHDHVHALELDVLLMELNLL